MKRETSEMEDWVSVSIAKRVLHNDYIRHRT
jgi:hypothetical protein